MRAKTTDLWAQQDRHTGDRHRLFGAVADAVEATTVLYPGSYVDVAASFVWPTVTYVDVDRRAAAFFDDVDGTREIIAAQPEAPDQPEVTFVPADYTTDLPFERGSFDMLISLYAGPISRHCTQHLRVGGWLLVNPSHGDAALASIDDRYELSGVVHSESSAYSVSADALDTYLIPKQPVELTVESIERGGRGIAYTKSPFAYLFRRIS